MARQSPPAPWVLLLRGEPNRCVRRESLRRRRSQAQSTATASGARCAEMISEAFAQSRSSSAHSGGIQKRHCRASILVPLSGESFAVSLRLKGSSMQQTSAERSGARVTGAYAIVTCLFFAWGFITSLVDPLVAAVKGIFHLSDVEAQLSAFAFFIAYGVMSLPGAVILARIKSVPSVLISLGLMVAGCLIMLVASNLA